MKPHDVVRAMVGMPCFKNWPDGTTHCNQFSSLAAALWRCYALVGKTANEQVALMENNANFEETNPMGAVAHAKQGSLVIAGRQFGDHGHVCVVLPEEPLESSTWGCSVPVVANVGKKNFVGRVSGAFTTEERPRYWKYVG